MASLSTNKKTGLRTIQFTDPYTKTRRTIRLGKMNKKNAEAFQTKLERLVFDITAGTVPDQDIAKWISTLPAAIADHLADWNLIPRRPAPQTTKEKAVEELRTNPELLVFVQECIDSRKEMKPATRITYRQFQRLMREFLESIGQVNIRVKAMTQLDAEKWRSWMLERGLSENTVRMHCKNGRLFFNLARKQRLITENPFAEIPCNTIAAPARFKFISAEDTRKVMDQAPDIEWRVVIAMARWGGVRIPSELTGFRWDHILWDAKRIIILQPKLERYKDKKERQIPLFPELDEVLTEALDLIGETSEYVLPRLRGGLKNFRTTLNKLVKRAGLPSWPEPFLTLRSTRDTELCSQFPIKTVSTWLGHDPTVSMESYQQVREEDWETAVSKTTEKKALRKALRKKSET